MRGIGSRTRDREIDAAKLQLLDAFGIVGELSRRIHLHLVAALGVLLDLLSEKFGGFLPRAAGLVGMAELEHGLGRGGAGPKGGDRDGRDGKLECVVSLHDFPLAVELGGALPP